MSRIKFSDGMSFNLKGPYRLVRRSDGWYVVGKGMLVPVDSPADGKQFIGTMEKIGK